MATEFKSEFDFHDLLGKPGKLFGYWYLYFLLALVGLGIAYVNNLTVIGKNAVNPVALVDSSALVRDIPRQNPMVIPPVDVAKAAVPSDAMISRGRDLFRANCSSCHGENGMGDGPGGAALNPKPRNFHASQGWTNGPKMSQIYRTLQEGIVKNGMASYNYIPPENRFALIHFVRTFYPGAPVDTPQELQQLELTYQLSKGSSSPGQIPVKKAAQILMLESAPVAESIGAVFKRMSHDQGNPGAAILNRVANDKTRIVVSCVARRAGSSSVQDFVRVVSADPDLFGFKAAVLRLSPEEWTALYQYIGQLGKTAPGS